MQLTKNQLKEFVRLKQKKYRQAAGLFMAEGEKLVAELLSSNFDIECLVAASAWLEQHQPPALSCFQAKAEDLKRLSNLQTAPPVIAIVRMAQRPVLLADKQLTLLLEDIQDPGNMGTILRLCDWFGISTIVASENTVELYNPKVVQASMGAICRVNVVYQDLVPLLEQQPSGRPVYGTFLSDAQSINDIELDNSAFIVMGNESLGISKKLAQHLSHRLYIPPYPPDMTGSESLNVATATAVILYEFRRRLL